MLSLDLFNSKFEKHLAEGTVDPVQEQQQDVPNEPIPTNINQYNTEEIRSLVKKIWAQISTHAANDEAGWLTLEWPNQPAVTLSRNQVWTVVNKIARMPSTQRNAFALTTLSNRNAFLTWINGLKIIPRPMPKKEVARGQQKLDLKELDQKKSSDEPKFKSTRLDRLKTQARAKYPAAGSDMEALAADFVDQQDKDQEEFDRVKGVNTRQDELLKQISALNREQDQEIDNLGSEEQRLQQNIAQLRSANAELAKKLSAMSAKRTAAAEPTPAPAAQPTLGVSVATDKQQPAPAAPPMDARARKYAQGLRKQLNQLQTMVALKAPGDQDQLRQDIETLKAQLTKLQQREPIATSTPATVGDQTADVLPAVSAADKQTPDDEMLDLTGISDVLDRFRPAKKTGKKKSKKEQPEFELTQEVQDIPFGMTENEAGSIPKRSVIQGYTVDYDPAKRQVTVSRRGQLVGRNINKSGNYKNYQLVVNRIIDASEEDKYPNDLEARGIAEALPAKAAEKLHRWKNLQRVGNTAPVVRTPEPTKPVVEPQEPGVESGNEMTAQDLLFRTAAKAMYDAGQEGIDIDYEDAIRTASRLMRIPYAPSQLPALQAQLQDVKKKIDTLKTVRRAKRQREQEKLTHQTTADEERRTAEWMKNYGNRLQQRLKTRQTESEEKKTAPSQAWEQGGREGYYSRPNKNPYKSGTQEYQDYNRGYNHYKDDGKDYLRELDLDRSGQPMYQRQEVYMLTHNGREVAFYKLKDLKRAEQDAQEMQKKLGGEVHIRKVMREAEQPQDEVMKRLFKDFGDIFGKPPPQPQKSEPEKKEVKEMGRAGYNAMNTEKDWHEVERYLSQMINDPSLDPETKKAYRQRYLEKRREAQQKGWAK